MLVPVDVNDEAHLRFLYEMLQYRNDLGFVNIEGLTGGTTKELPTYEQHKKYLQTTTRYKGHYIWVENGEMLGSAYLTQANELGLFIVSGRTHSGVGTKIVRALQDLYPKEAITAHIHVDNDPCNQGAARVGFKHVANFWVLEPLEK